MPTSSHGGIVTPTDSTVVDISQILLDMASSFDAAVVGVYANNTARDSGTSALRTAGKKGIRAFVQSPPSTDSPTADFCTWNGSEWIWDHPAPIFAVSPGLGASPAFNNTSAAQYTSAAYTFTPSRSGWLNVGFDADLASVTSGWITAYTSVLVNGSTASDHQGIVFETSRLAVRFDSRVPIWVTKNVNVGLTLNVSCFSATGSWRLNSFGWKLTLR